MKRLKRLGSLLLAVMMVLMVSVPTAFADRDRDTDSSANATDKIFTLTLEKPIAGHTYTAYQVLSGNLNKGVLSNVEAGDGVTGLTASALTTALKADPTLGVVPSIAALEDTATLDDVLTAISNTNITDDSDNADALAKVIGSFVDTTKGSTTAEANAYVDADTFEGRETGGYIFEDNGTNASPVPVNDANSKNMLEIVGNTTEVVKAEVPTIEKKIVEGENLVDANEAGIGDTVAYQIKGAVPDMSGYDYYYYVINDTLSAGLTLDPESFYVSIDGDQVDAENYRIYLDNDASPYTFQVAFKDLKANYSNKTGKDIVVRYTARVNENAVIGPDGNPNTVTLTYSNNPNDSGKGENDFKPGEDNPTGETPKDITKTYVAEIDIEKYLEDVLAKMGDAEFTLTGTSTKTVVKSGTKFVEDADGKYYKLADGTFTTTKPHGIIEDENGNPILASNESKYDDVNTTYKAVETSVFEEVSEDVVMVGKTDNDGKIYFSGLGAGTYTLTETKTPDGYNTIAPITITITIEVPNEIKDGTEKATISFTKGNGQPVVSEDGKHLEVITNKVGSTLPSTGGVGTTLFYIVGSILVLLAGALLVTRRRRAGNTVE